MEMMTSLFRIHSENLVLTTNEKMEDSYGVPFGKKSQTVTRNGTVDEASKKELEVSPAVPWDNHIDRQIYPVCVVGHASRKDLKQQMSENETNGSNCSNKRDKSESRNDFDHLISSDFNYDLPHPSKLRKVTSKKQVRMNRLIEKHMCVDNHLRQLRQRNTKYRLYKLEEDNKSSPGCESNPHSLQVPDVPSENIDAPHTLLEQTPPTSLSFQPPGFDFHYMKKTALSKQLLFPPGSVLVSATLEKEEEDKWFQQLWKPKCSSQTTEE